MKSITSKTIGLVLLTALFFGTSLNALAQTKRNSRPVINSPYALLQNPAVTNSPGAVATIKQVLATPPAPLSVPVIAAPRRAESGTYWTLQSPVPLPGDIFPDLPVYLLDATNRTFLIDDRSVDYAALQAQQEASNATNGSGGSVRANDLIIDTNRLWVSVATNALPGSNQFNIVIHETVTGSYYDVLTISDLLLPTWAVENTVVGAVGNETPVTLAQNDRTNLFVWARESIIPISTQPMAQEVLAGDMVTFTVIVGGSGLTYQWTLNGTNIYGATGNSYTIYNVQPGDAGDYACIITGAAGTIVSQAATLTVDAGTRDPNTMVTLGQRQDYTFRNGINYYIGSTVQLYGNTTIEGGTVVKFDYTQLNPCLQVLGTLTCKGTSYNPSILTTIDDDGFGKAWSYGAPQPYVTGVPYLDLSAATSLSVTNLRFRFADEALSTPAGGKVDVWDSQFFQCDAAIINEFGGRDCLHNVLMAGCFDGVAAFTNNFALTAEHLTADVTNLWDSSISPYFVGLTNSIILGSINSVSVNHSAVNPNPANFQTNGAGNYYLAAGSSLHQSGTTSVSASLLNEFRSKTTYAPLAFPSQMAMSGNLTLMPQVPRYTNGAPDLGYYYDALDYTVAGFTNFGSITVEPGTTIGFREDINLYTFSGFDLRENSSFVSHGTPTKPITFADVQLVQEQFEYPCCAAFVPDFESQGPAQPGPVMDFRFCNFYAGIGWYHIWAGLDANGDYMASYNSVVNWIMQDCNLHGGQISLGEPDNGNFFGIPYTTYYGSGAVAWNNNLFENVQLNLQPTFDWYDGTVNVDLAFSARNNLFRGDGSSRFIVVPVPASAGNWTLTDNLFDLMSIFQIPALALDFDYNGYWPLKSAFYSGDWTQLQATTTGDGTTDGLNEMVLSYAPAYQSGPFGNYYLTTVTPLWQAGSRTAGVAGLSQYTTFINQAKDSSNAPVNIGLHYVAATNSLPLDTDGDGVPDYVEVEHGTDPNNPMTDNMTPDALNAAYDDVDLDGDGLTGRAERILGTNPLVQDNPLTLTPIITGQEPYILTYSMPLSMDLSLNQYTLKLLDNGQTAKGYCFIFQTNNTYIVQWNSLFSANDSHMLQVKLAMQEAAIPSNDTGDTQAVNEVFGTTSFLTSSNLAQFDPDTSLFGSQAWISGTLTVQSADYKIEIYDTNSILLTIITNHTDSGVIDEVWNLIPDIDSSPRDDSEFNALIYITPSNQSASSSASAAVHANGVNDPQQFPIRFPYHLLRTANYGNGAFTMAFGSVGSWTSKRQDMIQNNVVDVLFDPSADNTYPNTYLNSFDGMCFFLGSTNDEPILLDDLSNGSVNNFYWDGHGSENSFGSATGDADHNKGLGRLGTSDVRIALLNIINAGATGWTKQEHPYRLVILNSCDSATDAEWANTFGIVGGSHDMQWFNRQGLPDQAFVGWPGDNLTPINPLYMSAYGAHLYDLFELWMADVPLEDCLIDASTPDHSVWFDMPLDSRWKIYGNPILIRDSQ